MNSEKHPVNIALFASGSGSNAVKIIEHFRQQPGIQFIVLCNKKDAPVLEKAAALGVKTYTFGRSDFYEKDTVVEILQKEGIRFIVLTGFLWLVPQNLVERYPRRIINIHPALLPKFGGKGLYGMNVHRAVLEAGEQETGITIHYVNENYDEGQVIFQERCAVTADDTPETIAKKVQVLEHTHFPKVVEQLVNSIRNEESGITN